MRAQSEIAQGATAVQRIGAAWGRSAVMLAFVLFVALGVSAAFFEGPFDHPLTDLKQLAVPFAAGSVGVAIVAWVTIYLSAVREVELSPEGLAFKVGRRRIQVAWEELVPPHQPYFITMNFRYRRGRAIQEKDPLTVSRPIARAILQYPFCPRFDLNERIWTSLGMRPPTNRAGVGG